MEVKIGCDIVAISRVEKLGKKALLKIFHESEIRNSKIESIAGMFAAKECCRKVFNGLQWHDITVRKMKDGKPKISISHSKISGKIMSSDVSISHDGGYAIAASVFLFE